MLTASTGLSIPPAGERPATPWVTISGIPADSELALRTRPSILLLAAWLIATAPVLGDDFIGSERCAGCHSEAFDLWQGSHHQLAMQAPGEQTVLGDFDDARFDYNGVTTRFYREGERFMVRTDGPDGAPADFPVRYVFGVYPLQQLLLPLDRGRLQAFSIAWDARPAVEGGQRWYHLYPDDAIDHRDPLHWTGPYLNWNSRCAECHSTQVEKRYSAAERRYDTRFSEASVGCEACHGPGATHVNRMQDTAAVNGDAGDLGLALDLAQRGHWRFEDGAPIASRAAPLQNDTQINACARCHARRSPLGDYHYGANLLDTHELALPQPPAYFPDGQIDDEVFVHGSFLQSRMQRAGVVCSNCHEPHSNRLRAEGNAVCGQCHQRAVYDTERHHRHAGGPGAQCVNCHMPEKRYMGVDDRRDHSMRIPRPDLNPTLGTPDACTQCHGNRDSHWASETLRAWGSAPGQPAAHPAIALQRLREGDARVQTEVAAQAADTRLAPIWRATALEALGGGDAVETAAPLLQAADPLLRASAARALRSAQPSRQFALLAPLLDDPVTAVRMAVAETLAGIPLRDLPPAQRDALLALFEEYLAVRSRHADMPETQLQLGVFHASRNDLPRAEAAYREALALDPSLASARLNLADLQRRRGDEQAARARLEELLEQSPENGNALHALGLLEIRTGNRDHGDALLRAAAQRETDGWRHRYVHAIALNDSSDSEEALDTLRRLNSERPGIPAVLLALGEYAAAAGHFDEAARHVRTLVETAPANPAYRQWLRRLDAARDQAGSNTR